MSRTYRNKSTVPHGWEVRDDGRSYCNSCCPNQRINREKNSWHPGRGVSRREFYRNHEYCDCYYGPPRHAGRWSAKERKDYRKAHWRQYRAKVKDAMHHAAKAGYEDDDWENLPQYRRTSGWLTW